MTLSTIDSIIFVFYCVILVVVAWWVSFSKQSHTVSSEDYFLAGRGLPWWAIGTSLIAANISAEQIIGMSGSGFAIGLAIASYEWMSAITLIIIAKYFVPIFLKNSIYTMPQFLEQRFDHRVRMVMAFFWLGVYVFINLTSVLYLGAIAIEAIAGVNMLYGMLFLVIFSVAYSLFGGLKAVAYTDIMQVVLLIFGGLTVSFLALREISEGQGIIRGFGMLLTALPEKFDLILDSNNPHYKSLPGISVLIGGMWVMNFSYWGFNQYITQRTLAAKSVKEAQKGIIFAAFLKLLMPVLVVLPGIAAAMLIPELAKPDQAYPEMLKLVPVGILGVTFAALVAAIASSLGAMSNSIATIFTVDIYSQLINKEASDREKVFVGRAAAFVSIFLAAIIAKPLLGSLDQAYQYIQEFTGFFTPGVVVIFLLGFFWKKATANSALSAAISSAALSLLFKVCWPDLPFMDRVGLVFLLCMSIAVVVTLFFSSPVDLKEVNSKFIDLKRVNFSTTSGFDISAFGVIAILVIFYFTWW